MVLGDGYEELEHTADWSLRIWGKSMADLLQSGARGMLAMMNAKPEPLTGSMRNIALKADDREALIVAWLDELIFRLELQRTVPIQIDLEAGDDWLRASVIEAPCASPQKPIKAVTFHGLNVVETPEGLEAVLVFDV